MKPIHWLPLAHHRRDQAHRCVLLSLGRARLALCARCLGLYPVMAGALVLQAVLRPASMGQLDWWFVLGASAPGLLDWGAGVVDPASGNNPRRLISGILLGAALGRSLWLYFGDPRHEIFWVQVILIIFTLLAVMAVKRIRPPQGI